MYFVSFRVLVRNSAKTLKLSEGHVPHRNPAQHQTVSRPSPTQTCRLSAIRQDDQTNEESVASCPSKSAGGILTMIAEVGVTGKYGTRYGIFAC